jgi:mono/diheme cytochrome c family protein
LGRPADLLMIAALALAGCPDEPRVAPTKLAPPPPVAEPQPPRAPLGALAQPLPVLPDEGPVYSVPGFAQHTTPLAPGEGRAALQAHCSTCHSTTYVTMQPPLGRAAWEATVTKMLKTYGAQVPDDAAQQVLAYLAAHYTPETVEASYAALASADEPVDAGARVFRSVCAACHQADGAGLPGAFPPLVGHAAALARDHRAHLLRLALYGQQGPIEVGGTRYDGAMPGQPQLSDDDVAAVLNHVVRAWGPDAGVAPYTADEVAAQRAAPLTPQEVHARRGE